MYNTELHTHLIPLHYTANADDVVISEAAFSVVVLVTSATFIYITLKFPNSEIFNFLRMEGETICTWCSTYIKV